MNKKTGLIAITIILTLIVLAALYYTNLPATGLKSCKKVNSELKNHILALKTGDTDYCQKTGNPQFCTAQVLKNPSFCSTYPDKDYCLALVTGKPELCHAEDFWCKADASKDASYCEKLPKAEQEECLASVSFNAEYYEQNLCD